ncbi:MAG: Fic/DOC family N-terminal domain-containing protein [Methylovirgula sp.]
MKRDNLTHAVRERLQRLPSPYQAHYGVVPLPPPEGHIPLNGIDPRLRAAHTALARIDTLAAELQDPYLISRILPRREAVSSSSIEGTNSTLDELLSIEETGDEKSNAAAVQVRDYALALDDFVPRARAQKHKIFTAALVQDLHRTVMAGDPHYRDKPGQFRQNVVWIGGGNIAYSTYNPAPPGEIAACLEQTMDYMRSEGMQQQTQSLIARMAITHSHFEAVHPFLDGNGRVGRLMLPLMMAAEGHMPLYLSPYIEKYKTNYYDSLRAAQQRLEWHEPTGFLADAIVGTVDELLVTRQALTELSNSWRNRRKFRQGSAAQKALDILPHYPVLTIKRLADILAVSIPAATQAANQLVEGGILNERTGYARNRVFSSPEALLIINRPFGDAPVVPDNTQDL